MLIPVFIWYHFCSAQRKDTFIDNSSVGNSFSFYLKKSLMGIFNRYRIQGFFLSVKMWVFLWFAFFNCQRMYVLRREKAPMKRRGHAAPCSPACWDLGACCLCMYLLCFSGCWGRDSNHSWPCGILFPEPLGYRLALVCITCDENLVAVLVRLYVMSLLWLPW